jgi:signal transduction histidine kinase
MDDTRRGESKGRSALVPDEGILERARILIVDDEESSVLLLQRILRESGYAHVQGTTDPRRAVALFEGFRPDLILLDLHMPHLSGFQVIEQLRPYLREGEYLPILILTADVDPDVRRKAKVAGVIDYMTKPIDRSEVLVRVKNPLETRFRYLEERASKLDERPILRIPEANGKERTVPVHALIKAVDRERRRIAGDIHDESLQDLASLKLRLELLDGRPLDSEDREAVAVMAQIVTGCISRLRRLAFEMWGAALSRGGLVTILRSDLEEASEAAGFSYDLLDRLASEPPPECRATAYRIAGEALSNVRKHASAGRVEVIVESRDDGVLVTVADDGKGFIPEDTAALEDRLGLLNIRERAEAAGGWCDIESAPGAGASVRAWLPLVPQVSALAVAARAETWAA